MNLTKFCSLLGVLLALAGLSPAFGADGLSAGPLYDEFYLALAPGHRTEAVGPLFYKERVETQRTWAVPPLISYTTDEAVELKELDILYPVLTYDRYGQQYRWQFLQLLAFAGGPSQEDVRSRITLFPLYFQQRSTDPSKNYTAVVPFYGHLKNRLFRDEIFFVMFPLYSQTKKRGVVTDNYVYPIFHLRRGPGLQGWQVWPLVGHEHKEITSRTNNFNEVSLVPGHDSWFALWPIFFKDRTGIGSDNPVYRQAVLPLYSFERSPKRDSTTIIWPFFSKINDRERKYREWDFPWPFWVIARGEGKNTTRFFPFYSQARSPTQETGFYMWPVYRYERAETESLERERNRVLFFLYSDDRRRNKETQATFRRTYLWPFFIKRRDYNGDSRLQVLAPLEPFVPASRSIQRNWSPLWSVWRAEKDLKTGAASQSLLWNLYRRDVTPVRKKVSFFFGLYQSQSTAEGRRIKLFYIPLGKGKAPESSLRAEEASQTYRVR
ncbi:MAG TPA: hypothetical protein VEC99_07660 [Clostridia bacterium]|nr:hypothetical protein [Clostridia bacterium]